MSAGKVIAMKNFVPIIFLLWPLIALPLQQTPSSESASAAVFRDPFTLKLHVDNGPDYEEHFDKAPYVADNAVYLFAGDSFGINLAISGDEISDVTYVKNAGKADVAFHFKQMRSHGRNMMLLMIQSKLKRNLPMDASMTVPGAKGSYKTSILPLGAGLSSFESWPQPIIQVVLKNFRFAQQPSR